MFNGLPFREVPRGERVEFAARDGEFLERVRQGGDVHGFDVFGRGERRDASGVRLQRACRGRLGDQRVSS